MSNWLHTKNNGLKHTTITGFIFPHAVVETCQSHGSHALKHKLLYHLSYSKCNQNSYNEHHAILKDLKLAIEIMSSLENCLLT